MRYGFYISSTSNRLIKFLNQASEDVIKEIKVVFSEYQIGDSLIELLKSNKIPYVFFDYNALDGIDRKVKNKAMSNALLETLEMYKVDYCFTYGVHILSGSLIEKFENRLINFHPAILPMYPGLKAIDKAVAHGNTFLVGNTVHFIDKGVDTGTIIMQSVVPMQAFLDSQDYDVILDLQIEMLNSIIRILDENRLSIRDGRAIIKNADYKRSNIYPEINF